MRKPGLRRSLAALAAVTRKIRLAPLVSSVAYRSPALMAKMAANIDIISGAGPGARSIKMPLPQCTLVGATTRAGLLTSPLRDRFGVVQRLDFYSEADLLKIVTRSAAILNVSITPEGAMELARRSRGTPRVANRLLRRVRDFAQVLGNGTIDGKAARDALTRLEVDERGFDEMDRRILHTIIEKFSGGPVGIETLAVAVGEEADTIEDVYEPFLIQLGFLARTPRGRTATRLAYAHLQLPPPPTPQGELWSSGGR
jgi:Holliday junction DNA helicase RuvB